MARLEMEGVLTKTAAYTPAGAAGTDISSASLKPAFLHLEVLEMKNDEGNPTAHFQFEDTVNDFVASVGHASKQVVGPIKPECPMHVVFPIREWPLIRFGTASAELRCKLISISGTNPSVKYVAWIEHNG
jgi:hypothetical protein